MESSSKDLPPLTVENKDFLLMVCASSYSLRLISKSLPQLQTHHTNISELHPSFDFDKATRVTGITISENSRFFTLFLDNRVLMLFSLTILDKDLEDLLIEPVHPHFRLDSFRFPLWKKHCLYFASEKRILKVDPRVPLEMMSFGTFERGLKNALSPQHISTFTRFKEFDSKILDFSKSHVLELLYVLLEFNAIKVVNLESNVILRSVIPFSGSPNPHVKDEICRIFPLLRVKRTDRPNLDDLKSHDFKLRDFILLLRRNGHAEIVRLNDFRLNSNIPRCFKKQILDRVDSPSNVNLQMDFQQEFVGLSLPKKLILFRVSDHFSQYNKAVHSKGKQSKTNNKRF
jgi:hypothetical protein